MLGSIARSQLYADSRNGVPMKILNVLPVKMGIFVSLALSPEVGLLVDPDGRAINSFRR
jgi:hypothetical protein